MVEYVPKEVDAAGIEKRLVSLHPLSAYTVEDVTRVTGVVDLSDPHKARTAIVLHEIFSSPKALRPPDEMWDQ